MTERSFHYPAKDYLRGAFVDFCAAGPGTVVYLPGSENLEFPLFAAKGYAPADLVGAEHNGERFPEVERNARGITLVRGSIRDAVELIERERRPFASVASLDFDGSYDTDCPDLLAMARVFPAEPAGFLQVTSYSARDRDTVRQGVIAGSKFYSGLANLERFQPGYARMLRRHEYLRRHLETRERNEQAHLSRECGFLWWMVLFMGFMRFEDGGYGTLDSAGVQEANDVLSRISNEVVALGRGTEFTCVRVPELRRLFARRRCQMWPTDFRHFAYASRMNQPMRSWFFRICPMRGKDRPTVLEVLEQVWELAVRAPLVYVDPHGDPITFG